MRGRISPNVMAMMIRNAVAQLVAMLVSRATGALGPIETNSTTPAAALNRKKPGIIEATAEKARAAKGRRRRSTIGVAMTLTSIQATSAPVTALPPATVISAQRAAWASMPAAIGNANRRHGIEKNVPNEATAHPAAITSITSGTGGNGSSIGRLVPTAANPNRRPALI